MLNMQQIDDGELDGALGTSSENQTSEERDEATESQRVSTLIR